MNIYEQMAVRIIQSQEAILSEEAVNEARKVPALLIDWNEKKITILGDKKKAIEQLVEHYRDNFGQPGIEVCKEAVRNILNKLPEDGIPSLLR